MRHSFGYDWFSYFMCLAYDNREDDFAMDCSDKPRLLDRDEIWRMSFSLKSYWVANSHLHRSRGPILQCMLCGACMPFVG